MCHASACTAPIDSVSHNERLLGAMDAEACKCRVYEFKHNALLLDMPVDVSRGEVSHFENPCQTSAVRVSSRSQAFEPRKFQHLHGSSMPAWLYCNVAELHDMKPLSISGSCLTYEAAFQQPEAFLRASADLSVQPSCCHQALQKPL